MKLSIGPKNLFRARKNRSVSRSDPPSFGSGTTSSSSDSSDSINHHKSQAGKDITNGLATPTSVLPARSHEITADEWLEVAANVNFDLVTAFKVIDRDGDGKITRADLEALLSRIGPQPPSDEELTMMLSDVDRDGDGCISLEEFGALSSSLGPPACDDELRVTFNFFDTNQDGKITAEELLCGLTSIGDGRCTLEDCRRMISGVDKNGDGFVCFEDFSRMMEQPR